MTKLADVPFFTPKEVAQFLRVSRATIYRWIDEGLLKAIKPRGQHNGHLRITREDILEFCQRHWQD